MMRRLSIVTFMNRLKYMQKFVLIGVLFMLPVGLTMYLLITDIDKEIDFGKKERLGIEYNNGIRKLLDHLQQHRGMANVNLNGNMSFENSLSKMQLQIDKDITEIDQTDQKLGIQLKTNEKWMTAKEKWGNLEKGAFNRQPQEIFDLHNPMINESFELHTALISDMLSLIIHVGDTSGLKLDPGQDSYFLMNTLVNKLPLMIETVAQARGLGSGNAAKKTLSLDEKKRLIILSGNIQSAMDSVKNHIGITEDSDLKVLLQPYIQDNLITTAVFLDILNNEIINAKDINIQPANYFGIATTAIDSGYKLYDVETPELDSLLKERIYKLYKKKLFVAGFALALCLLTLYLYRGFYESVIGTVFTLKRAAIRFAGGDLSVRVGLHTRDELQLIGSAFNKVADAFSDMMVERRRYEEKIEYQAYYDTLTGLPNRLLFNDHLKLALASAHNCSQKLGVMFLDLDRFKVINDTLGHHAGDLLLRVVAERLNGGLSQKGTVYRMGGDEFLFILPDIQEVEDARAAARKILDLFTAPILLNSHEFIVSASIGISVYPMDGEDIETLVKNADVAMYYAKNHGRNSYRFYESHMNDKADERLQMETSLRRALERGEFILYYQPRFSLMSSKIIGMEALIRWNHPDLGFVPPMDFISLAEETGFIIPLGEWVLRTACLQYKVWQQEGVSPFRMSVNISAVQFIRDEFVALVKCVLEESSLDPGCLELELTESVVMENGTMVISKLEQLKELGVKISIDDFGTGFSSLSYLKDFPIDSLKIDRSFIKDIPNAPKDTAITKTIIALGRRLNLNVVAEGVETEEQLAFLTSRKCNEVQGYLISRPLPPEEAVGLLREPMQLKKSVLTSLLGDEEL